MLASLQPLEDVIDGYIGLWLLIIVISVVAAICSRIKW